MENICLLGYTFFPFDIKENKKSVTTFTILI